MAKDPVCGMDMNEDSMFRSEYGGNTYVFCSESCKAKFDKEPGWYVKLPAAGGHLGGHHHSCC